MVARVGEESNKNPYIEKFFAMVQNKKKGKEEIPSNGFTGFDGHGKTFIQCVQNYSTGSFGTDAGST